jgi:imidazolonepropionase-like amidohydrolase
MAHGVTTIRGVSFGPEELGLSERERSANNEIVAPRIVVYQRPPGWDLKSADEARKWVQGAAVRGVEGLKLDSYPPEIMAALIDEAHRNRMGTVAHLSQMGVAQMNARDAARVGLDCVTHFYGIFEALYKDHDVQPWPMEMNYNNEQYRFGQVARQWVKIHPPGSDEWKALLQEFKERGTILDATMVAYLASRDVMRARSAEWHEKYTLPSLWQFYQPNRAIHGSYFYDWTTADEIAWRNFYRVWMEFIDDYNDIGGRVTVSDDAAFIYNLWGFGIIQEMELFQEAGFHPLEVIRSATLYPAQAIFEPKRQPIEYGVIRPNMLADLAIVGENPLHNLKVLYGTGTPKLNDETGQVERIGGIELVVKDGIVYDAKRMLADVAKMVEDQKNRTSETTTDEAIEN